MDQLKSVFIYCLLDPESLEVRYVGKTISPRRRWLNHLCEKSRTRRGFWIRSLIKRGLKPEMQIAEEIKGAWPWQESERFWIRYALANGCRLTNMTSGGDGVPDWAASPKRHYGDDHWTRKKPELVAGGDRNGARRHPDAIWRGSLCKSSKLDELKIVEIRNLKKSGKRDSELAQIYGVSQRNIWEIVNRRSWKHVE